MNVLDLFSGIGGFSLGLERAGMRTVAFCEIDPYCRAVIKKHWPNVPILEDVRTVSRVNLRQRHRVLDRIDVICGGFPCQPFSVAGKQKGKTDDRHLWPYMRDVINEFKPAWVIGENVAGFIPMELDQVLSDLEAIGYETLPLVIPACAVDAHHRRDRVWIIARNTDEHSESTGSLNAEMEELRSTIANSESGENWRLQHGGMEPDIASNGETDSDSALLQWREIKRNESDGAVRSNEDDADAAGGGWSEGNSNARGRCERARATQERSGLADGSRWPPEPDVGRVAHGIPSRVDRLRCLGNAIVPQIPEIIARAIMKFRVVHGLGDLAGHARSEVGNVANQNASGVNTN